jgi:hypothetical protein
MFVRFSYCIKIHIPHTEKTMPSKMCCPRLNSGSGARKSEGEVDLHPKVRKDA